MKSIIFTILGLLVGYILGAYSVFNLTINFGADKIAQIITDNAQNIYTGSGLGNNINVNNIIDEKKQQVLDQISKEKDKIKNNLQQQLQSYVTSRINEMFSGF